MVNKSPSTHWHFINDIIIIIVIIIIIKNVYKTPVPAVESISGR